MPHRAQRLSSRQILWLTVVGLAAATLVAGAFLTPLLDEEARPILMAGYRQVCHQIPSRSFHVAGVQVALCHRCVGIWGALPLAVILFAALRHFDSLVASRPGTLLALSLLPIGVDWTADALGFWDNTMLSRLLTGAVFGLVAGYVLAGVVAKSVRRSSAETKSPDNPNTIYDAEGS